MAKIRVSLCLDWKRVYRLVSNRKSKSDAYGGQLVNEQSNRAPPQKNYSAISSHFSFMFLFSKRVMAAEYFSPF